MHDRQEKNASETSLYLILLLKLVLNSAFRSSFFWKSLTFPSLCINTWPIGALLRSAQIFYLLLLSFAERFFLLMAERKEEEFLLMALLAERKEEEPMSPLTGSPLRRKLVVINNAALTRKIFLNGCQFYNPVFTILDHFPFLLIWSKLVI